MAEQRQRRDKRYGVPLSIDLSYGSKRQRLLTSNVSYRGLFARTDDPPPARALVEMTTQLPPDALEFQARLMVVWVVGPADATEDRPPGVGLQFYAMGGDKRSTWERFMLYARRHAESTSWSEQPLPEVPDAPPPTPDATRRKHPRHLVRLAVRPASVTELITLYTRDISKGGMFLSTDRSFEIGTELELRVAHPELGTEFTLTATVRRLETEGGHSGIGVEFCDLDVEIRDAFEQFAHSTVEELDVEELEFVEEGDEKLE